MNSVCRILTRSGCAITLTSVAALGILAAPIASGEAEPNWTPAVDQGPGWGDVLEESVPADAWAVVTMPPDSSDGLVEPADATWATFTPGPSFTDVLLELEDGAKNALVEIIPGPRFRAIIKPDESPPQSTDALIGLVPGPSFTNLLGEPPETDGRVLAIVIPGPSFTNLLGEPTGEDGHALAIVIPGPSFNDSPEGPTDGARPALVAMIPRPSITDLFEPLPSAAMALEIDKPMMADHECTEADVNNDHFVDEIDLQLVLDAWGIHTGPEDCNGDGCVDALDVIAVLMAWGACA